MSNINEELALAIGMNTTSFTTGTNTVVSDAKRVDQALASMGTSGAGGVTELDARFRALGVTMGDAPKKFASASAFAFEQNIRFEEGLAEKRAVESLAQQGRLIKTAEQQAAESKALLAAEERLAELRSNQAAQTAQAVMRDEEQRLAAARKVALENAAAIEAIFSAEQRLAEYRNASANMRMTLDQKSVALQAEAVALEQKIAATEERTVERAQLQLQLEQNKNAVSGLTQKIASEQLATQAAIAEHTASQERAAKSLGVAWAQVQQILASIGVVIGAGAVLGFTNDLLNNATALKHQGESLGVNTTALQSFKFAINEAGGDTESANRVWTTTKQKLDDLRAGVPAAVADFGALGLTVKDFVGLSLDQSLEKTARAYVTLSDRAGTYGALQSIVGKGGRDLTDVLKTLGTDGFAKLAADAEKANAVIKDGTIRQLDAMNNEIDRAKATLKTVSSEAILPLSMVFNEVANNVHRANGFLETSKAIMGGLEAVANPTAAAHLIMANAAKRAAEEAERTKKALEDEKKPLVETTALTAERVTYEKLLADLRDEGLSKTALMADLGRQIAAHQAAAAAASGDQVKAQKEMNIAAELAVKQRKTELEIYDLALADLLKIYATEQSHATLREQKNSLLEEQKVLTDLITDKESKSLDTTKEHNALDETRNKLQETNFKIIDERLKAEGDLLSLSKQTVASALVALDVLSGHLTQKKVQLEVEGLLMRGVENLTEAEKRRLVALSAQLTPLQRQQEINEILARGIVNEVDGTIQLTEADKIRLAVLTGQTVELGKQVDKLKEQMGIISTIKSSGPGYANESTADLQYAEKKLKDQLFAEQQADQKNPFGHAFNAAGEAQYGLGAAVQVQLAQVQAELQLRQNFERSLVLVGRDRASMQFSPAEFADLLKIAMADATSHLSSVDSRLSTILNRG